MPDTTFWSDPTMNIVLWIVAGMLAAGYTAGGTAMLVLTKAAYRSIDPSQRFVDDLPAGFVKLLGAIKVLGAAGLILPGAVGIRPELVPMAALGFMLVMSGAATLRISRREWGPLLADLVLFSLAAFVAWGRTFAWPLG